MVLPQLIRPFAYINLSRFKHQSLLFMFLHAKQFSVCAACQISTKLSTFPCNVSSFDDNTFKSHAKIRKYSLDTKDTVSAPPSIVERMKSKLQYVGWLVTRSSILQVRARQIYASCTDDVDYKEFFKVCNMPDTFQSWFLVIHLHIWMCYVRLNMLGQDGQTVNQKMAEIMWEDIRERIKQLGVEDPKARKEGFKELSKQFYGLTIAYNKALMSENKKELEDVIFKTFLKEQKADKRGSLNILVSYVDKQLDLLDSIAKDELLTNPKIEWIPLKTIVDSCKGQSV